MPVCSTTLLVEACVFVLIFIVWHCFYVFLFEARHETKWVLVAVDLTVLPGILAYLLEMVIPHSQTMLTILNGGFRFFWWSCLLLFVHLQYSPFPPLSFPLVCIICPSLELLWNLYLDSPFYLPVSYNLFILFGTVALLMLLQSSDVPIHMQVRCSLWIFFCVALVFVCLPASVSTFARCSVFTSLPFFLYDIMKQITLVLLALTMRPILEIEVTPSPLPLVPLNSEPPPLEALPRFSFSSQERQSESAFEVASQTSTVGSN